MGKLSGTSELCLFCRRDLPAVTDMLCRSCETWLFEDGLEFVDLQSFRAQGTESLYYHLVKIDHYFQTQIDVNPDSEGPSEDEKTFHTRRIDCLNECYKNSSNADGFMHSYGNLSKLELDWAWWQFMEIYFMDLNQIIPPKTIMSLVKAHFSDELKACLKRGD